jgi:hypothetical protein
MEREFDENEVWEVVRNLKEDKAPGPDGFCMRKVLGGVKERYIGGFQGFSYLWQV